MPPLAGSPIEEVRQKLDLVDLISARVELKKAGRSWKGLCPFHGEKTPSFVVSPERQTWHCFGCGAGGDVFAFVMKAEGVEFGEALRMLAVKAGVTLDFSPRKAAENDERRRILAANQAAARLFARQLGEPGKEARDYLEGRGVSAESVERFGLGYAVDSWDSLLRALKHEGFTEATLAAAGLISEREGGGYYDRFRHKLTIPIRDPSGAVLGFGTRVLDDSLPKYINSPQTPVFDKSACLFGIDLAREAIREAGEVVIVEGYFDAILPHQEGVRNVVAAMGTALTDRQMALLQRFTTRVILALDPDAAGQAATMRGLETARESFGRATRPVPQPGGRVRYESFPKVDLRVATLPAGKDPDELVRGEPHAWERLMQSALPVLEFKLRRIAESHDLREARGKSAAFAELVPFLREISDRVERAHYIARAADLLQLSPEVLNAQMALSKPAARPARPSATIQEQPGEPAAEISASPAGAAPVDEEYLLTLLLREPRLVAAAGEHVAADDFGESLDRALFQWLSRFANGQIAGEAVPVEFESRAAGLLEAYPPERHPGGDALEREIIVSAASLRLRRVCEQLDALRYVYDEPPDDADRYELRLRQERLSQQRLTLEKVVGPRPVVRSRPLALANGER